VRKCITISAVAILLIASLSFGADYIVNSESGSDSFTGTSPGQAWKTITYAISNAKGTETEPATIHILAGTYSIDTGESFPLVMKNYINIKGENPATTIIDAFGSETQGLTFTDGANNVILEGITIMNAGSTSYNGGGISCIKSSPVIRNCNITRNNANYGAGIYCYVASPSISNCEISENGTPAWGAGLYLDKSPAIIDNCLIIGNVAGSAGGIYCYLSSATINNCRIIHNQITGSYGGGGINVWYDPGPTITNCNISDNQSYDGGGIYCYSISTIVMENCEFQNNVASNDGGGIYFNNATFEVKNILIASNSAKHGGGIYSNYSSPTFRNFTLSNNSAKSASDGGLAIYAYGSSVITITDSIIWDLSTSNHICCGSEAQVSITYSDVKDNYNDMGNMSVDPEFVTNNIDEYYISQTAAGQSTTSPCVDAGSDTVANLKMSGLTTRTDSVSDSGKVDMGYHYPGKAQTDKIQFALSKVPAKETFSSGDHFSLLLDIQAPSKDTPIDIYFVLLNVNTNKLYFAFTWDMTPVAILKNFTLSANFTMTDAALRAITLPSQKPPISSKGNYAFAIAAAEPNTLNFISNIATASFEVK
jgi:predicted outer membrane repeat protein